MTNSRVTVVGDLNLKTETEVDQTRKVDEITRGKDTERGMIESGEHQPPPFVPYPMYCQLLERVRDHFYFTYIT